MKLLQKKLNLGRERFFFLLGLFLWGKVLFLPPLFAQVFNHPELKWSQIQTPHFLILYHQGEEKFAQEVAETGERLYLRLKERFGFEPRKKTVVIVEDVKDLGGAYTDILTGKIWLSAFPDPEFTSGNLSWPGELTAHEYTHAFTFSSLSESIFPLRRRIAALVLPLWFVEGLAQEEGERWHSLKEMWVREAWEGKNLLSLGDLEAFYFFAGWERILGYYQSHSFLKWLVEKFGAERIGEILKALREQPILRIVGFVNLATGEGFILPLPRLLDFEGMLKKATGGKGSSSLYEEWKKELEEKYKKLTLRDSPPLPPPFLEKGREIRSPQVSRKGDLIGFVSDEGYEYSLFDLYTLSLPGRKIKRWERRVGKRIALSPEGKRIVYSKIRYSRKKNDLISDLYLLDLEKRKKFRLTQGERALEPSFSPEGKKIVFVKAKGGNLNLYLLDLEERKQTPLTFFKDGITLNFSPSFSPEGKKIVFTSFREGKRDIYLLDLVEKKEHPLTLDEWDDRDPVFSPDGKRIFFVSDRDKGTFNLFSFDLSSQKLTQHTELRGGVFEPFPFQDKLAFILYRENTRNLYILPLSSLRERKIPSSSSHLLAQKKEREEYPSSPYHPKLHLNYLSPWIEQVNEDFYFSLEGSISDELEKNEIYLSWLTGRENQYFLSYSNRSFKPTLGFNLYRLEGEKWVKEGGYPEKLLGGEVFIFYPLNDKNFLSLGYTCQKVSSWYFDSSRNLKEWEGVLSFLNFFWLFSSLVPLPDPELSLWGTKFFLFGEYGEKNLGSDFPYFLYGGGLYNYHRFRNGHTLAFRLRREKIENKLPFPRRLLSVGGETLRGYPEDYLLGENRFIFSLEYRFPLLKRIGGGGILYLDRLGGALFFDGASSWDEGEKREIKRSVGFELRLRVLPFGKSSLLLRAGGVYPLDRAKKGIKAFFSLNSPF